MSNREQFLYVSKATLQEEKQWHLKGYTTILGLQSRCALFMLGLPPNPILVYLIMQTVSFLGRRVFFVSFFSFLKQNASSMCRVLFLDEENIPLLVLRLFRHAMEPGILYLVISLPVKGCGGLISVVRQSRKT